jgi:hypothetical protein
VSSSATSKKKKSLLQRQAANIENIILKEKKALEESGENNGQASCDIIGDNIDICRTPSQMSIDRKRQTWHWFLLVGLQKRVLRPSLNDKTPIAEINSVDNSTFIPNIDDHKKLDENFTFHISNVLVKYMACFKKYRECIPTHIPHPHLKELSEKSNFALLDMLDKNENKSEDMITILEHIHSNYIAHTDEDIPSVIQKKVFGGDVLTNERAYTAQLAMLNGNTDFDRLGGIVHRPEGLHRMMNLLLVSHISMVFNCNSYCYSSPSY